MFEWRGRLRRYKGTIPRINPLVLWDVQRAQKRLDRHGADGAAGRAVAAPRAPPSGTAMTAYTWLQRNMRTRSGKAMVELLTEAVWAAQPEDISLLHMLFYIHSAGSLDMLLDTDGGAQDSRFVGGSQRGADRAGGPAWRRRDPVGARAPDRARATGAVTLATDAGTVRAKQAIVAIAPTLAGRIVYDPPLPGFRDQLTQRMPLGTVAQVHGRLRRAVLARRRPQRPGTSDVGPIKLTFDNSPPDGSPGVLLGFLEGQPRAAGRQARARGAARAGGGLLPAPVRRARGAARSATSSACGPRRSSRAAATGATCRRAPGPTTARRCARRSARCTGRAPRSPRCGRVTWTARCARASRSAREVLAAL